MRYLAILAIAAVLVTAGCVGQQTGAVTGLHILEKDGVEYEFSTDIREALEVPVDPQESILEILAFAPRVVILFDDSPDNPLYAKHGFELTTKLSHYYVYTQNRIVDISGVERSESGWLGDAVVIEFRGPASGADSTDVSLTAANRILVQGADNQSFALAVDRLALVLFEDELPSFE